MKKLLSLGIATALLASACAVYAFPTLTGPTGTGVQPTAAVVPAGSLSVAADYYNTESSVSVPPAPTAGFTITQQPVEPDIDNSYPVRVQYGLGSNIELGGLYNFQQAGGDDSNTWGVNAKYVTPVHFLNFDWAIGGFYNNTDVKALDITAKTTQGYVAGTGFISRGDESMPMVKATVGGNWTQLDIDGEKTSAIRPFVGVEVLLPNKLTVFGDYQLKNSKLDDEQLFSFGLRYQVSGSIAAQVGYTNAAPSGGIGLSESNVFAGVNLALGGK